MKRRLLTIAHSYVVGLNRRLAHELARVGQERWEVTAVAPRYFHGSRDLRPVSFQPLCHEPCRVDAIPAYLTRHVHGFWYGSSLRRTLAQSWDVVHCWEEPYVFAGWQVARWARPGNKLVFATFQNQSKNYPPPFNWLETSSMRRAAGWIPFGQTGLNVLLNRPGYAGRPFRMIPPGIDTDLFRPNRAQGAALRQSLSWSADGPPVIGFLGRFIPEKGLALLMQALDRQTSPWRALFVGAGPLEAELRQWAQPHGGRVRICANVAHTAVPRYLNAMDFLCAPSQTTPSWREQFGRMLIEAFACGLPVIGSDSGEIPHVVREDGVIVAEADESAWTAAIQALLEAPERRRELGAHARERAVREYAWPVVARRHLEFFEELLDEKGIGRDNPPTALIPAESSSDDPRSDTGPPPSTMCAPLSNHSAEDPTTCLVSDRIRSMSKPLRLLSLAHSYVVAANRRLAYAMQKAGDGRWEVTTAAPTYFHGQSDLRPVRLRIDDNEPCPLVPLSAYLTRSVHLFCYGRGLRSLFQQDWDLVHCWEEPFVVAGAQTACWMPRDTPFVFRTAQSLPKRYPPPFKRLERYVLERSAGWICSGQTVADNLRQRNGYDRRPMALIPLGVDVDRFRPDAGAGRSVRLNLGWTEPGPPVVGFLGRFVRAKGLDRLMRTLEAVRTPWRTLLVGAGPLEAQLREWSKRFPDRVRICPDVRHDDVPSYLNAMDVMLAPSQTTPSWREQFGRMLIEAFACGVPVIGSDSGEIPHVIRQAGLVVGERDAAGWQRAVGEVLENVSLRRQLGAAGRERAVNEFDWSVIGRLHLQFFERVLGGSSK